MLKTLKFVIPSASCFVLSFLISIIRTHRFGVSLLRGLIFALIFALLTFAVKYLFEKVLNLGEDSDEEGVGETEKKSEHKVDLTLDGENLTEDAGPRFYVGNNKHSLGENDTVDLKELKKDKPLSESVSAMSDIPDAKKSMESDSLKKEGRKQAEETISSPVFSPAGLADITKKEKSSGEKEMTSSSSVHGQDKVRDSEIDMLPDMQDYQEENTAEEIPVEDGDLVEDSDFASEGNVESSTAKFADGSSAESKDSETIAKAIRTILKREE